MGKEIVGMSLDEVVVGLDEDPFLQIRFRNRKGELINRDGYVKIA